MSNCDSFKERGRKLATSSGDLDVKIVVGKSAIVAIGDVGVKNWSDGPAVQKCGASVLLTATNSATRGVRILAESV